MKKLNLLFGINLILTLALSLIIPCTARAESYTYSINIVLGGTEEVGADFLTDMSNYLTIMSGENSVANAKVVGDTIKISGLNYNDQISFNPKGAVSVAPQEGKSYYVKGMRVSGSNDVVSASTFTVTKDNSYVIAYGVGAVVPYTVKYLDEAGNQLLETATYYGALGDEVYVPYRFIDGYVPNAYNIHAASLKENQEFVFTYKKGTGSAAGTVYNTNTVTSYGTVQGENEIQYQIVQVGGGEGVVNNRQDDGAAAAAGGQGGQGQNEAGAEGAGADETTSIEDTETPMGVEDVIEIDEEEVAKSIDSDIIYDTYKRYAFVVAIIGSILVLTIIGATAKENYDKKHKN